MGFDLTDFDLAGDHRLVNKLIATFFGSNRNYFLRQGIRPEQLERQHVLTPMHMEILSLAQMYTQPLTDVYDDRSSAIELQLDHDVNIHAGNLLGVVLPDDFKRAAPLKAKFESLDCQLEYYEFYPLRVDQYYWAIYSAVERILKRAKVL
jgi:hypothetical protein